MNHFERTAFFTMVEAIEMQLRGLKTLVAASANQAGAAEHKVTRTIEPDSIELSDEEEDKLAQTIEKARQHEIERMGKAAEKHFQSEFETVIAGMSSLNG